ncbi:DUF998 domain-containing protein [Micromonospora parathelypteridis]|uniref:DUF998 domain-containing protein n=1 Tax=Micromonospora parathelypteridis TaxID=1839617 RepID=A0A840VGV9_9ACTN|nr:DUF998 domain-containing protein [Micromonospora parathelypteridis]MBB5475885.1 hypothetical protein [Micromonospora parathelypteridis]GGO31887.1 hypothetical protein GCM10011576_61430 [Micromonospora parathelypteridis]
MTSLTTAPDLRLRRTRILLGCGTVAGVLFPALSFGQAFTRAGFDLRRHAVSALTLGDLGWLQVIAFVGTGLLAVAFAVGLWWVLRPGRAGTVVPVLVGIYGVAMVGGGIFVPDPALGWPPGAPAGLPEQASTGSILHTVCGAAAFLSLIAAGLLLARRFAGQGRQGWAVYSAVSGAVAFVLTALPWSEESASIRFAVGAVLISGWLVALSWRARDEVA